MIRRRITKSNTPQLEDAWVNLTPLIDVVFVVLIMFIVVTPMLEIDQLELPSGNRTNSFEDIASLQSDTDINIHVHKDNSIWLNKRLVTVDQLPFFLKEANMQYPNKTPKLFQDQFAYFGTYQEVKNAVQEAGFDQIDVILKPI